MEIEGEPDPINSAIIGCVSDDVSYDTLCKKSKGPRGAYDLKIYFQCSECGKKESVSYLSVGLFLWIL